MTDATFPENEFDSHTTRSSAPLIRVRDLTKTFGEQTVLDRLSLDVMQGETMVVMGGSGCGKSTFLRLLIGSLSPTSGSVELFGHDLSQQSEASLSQIKQQFGILFQSGALFNSMTVAENVALPMLEHSGVDPSVVAIQVKIKLEQVGLREHASKLPSQISGGMKKRAGLARALMLDPKILFYDEPSAGLDPVTSAEIDQLILRLSRELGVTSVVVTHEMNSAFTIADRMCMLDKGCALMIGASEDFDRLRTLTSAETSTLTESQLIVRQFLRGEADGPLTARRSADDYLDDLQVREASRIVVGSGGA
ncbi:MAG: ATP-binding cassette domain-containing protein [Phycisphaerales bacterium]|nr:ATP-binding cassette domain-containing protein [Phycisphaerales bacterium]